jgi:hypothetical protein
MAGHDHHSALRIDEIITQSLPGPTPTAQLTLAKLQWGKEDIAYNLHVAPFTRTSSGIQRTDFLNYLGFERNRCQFVTGQQCYTRWVDPGFNQEGFWHAFEQAYAALLFGQQELHACGLGLPQSDGRTLIHGRISRYVRLASPSGMGDGHTASSSKLVASADDEQFRFAYSSLEMPNVKGWVTHYSARHAPPSSESEVAFAFLGLQGFDSCPQFDFEPCHWRFVPFRRLGQMFVVGNVATTSNSHLARQNFDAHPQRFSQGLKALLTANSLVEPFGMSFLEMPESPHDRTDAAIKQGVIYPQHRTSRTAYEFDVAISVAGTERPQAEQLASLVKSAGFSVFYDGFYPEMLWGKNLVEFFDEIYRKRSARCVMFISTEYANRMWTIQERRSAQARALSEKGTEYILPIKVDDTELPGMPPTIGYVELEKFGIDKIAELLVTKLRGLKG